MHPSLLLLLVAAFSASVSCARSCVASFVPKLDLTGQLTRSQSLTLDQHAHGRVELGVAAWLRWQPTIYAAYVPERYELAPSAWVVPCDADDSDCFAEVAQDERELSDALQEAP